LESTGQSNLAESASPAAHRSNLPTRIVWTLLSPGRLFEELRAEPRFLGVLAVGAVAVCIANAAVPADLWEQVIQARLLSAGEELPDDLSRGATFTRWSAALGSLVFWPILIMLVAGLYNLVFRLGLGYRGAFRQYLSVTAHAMLIGAAGALVLLPLRIFAQNAQLQLTLGALLPEIGEGLLGRSLTYLDLFDLWASGLIGLGASILDGSRSVGSSIGFALGVTLLLALVLAATIV
jgi:hypothetical protein